MRKHLRTLLTVAVLILFVGYFMLNKESFKPLLDVNGWLLGLIMLCYVGNIVFNGLTTKLLLIPFKKVMDFRESVYVALISAVGNFFTPAGGGFGIRAVYLKKKHDVPYGEYAAILSGNYILVFLVNASFALVALYMLRDMHAEKGYFALLLAFGGTFAVSLLLSLTKVPSVIPTKIFQAKYLNKLSKILLQMVEGWSRIVADRKLMLRLVMLVAVQMIIGIIMAKLEMLALHFTISLPALILFSVLGSLSLFVSITPANLGVKEAIYLFSGSIIGLTPSQILSIALIDRGAQFIVLTTMWLYVSRQKLASKILLKRA